MDVMTPSQAPGKSLPSELMYGGASGLRRLLGNNEVVQQRGVRGLGLTADEWAAIVQSATAETIPLIIAQNPGTLYTTNPKTGQITVYAQPTGSNQNLPVGVVNAGGGTGAGAGGSIQTPVGSATFGGIDANTLLVVGGLGLLAFLMMRGHGR